MAKNSITVPLAGYLKNEAEKFVGEKKPYAYLSNLVEDSVRRRLEELRRLSK